MTGHVDDHGRALIEVALVTPKDRSEKRVTAWIDTGFNGHLVLSRHTVETLGLSESGTVSAILADGSETSLITYECPIKWFDREILLQVVANEGDYPLLGVRLLRGCRLLIDYRSAVIEID